MDFKNQIAIAALTKLREAGFKSAIVSGGCVRDSIFGKPIKDIDIFVSYEEGRLLTEEILNKIFDREIECLGAQYEKEETGLNIFSVYEIIPSGDGELPIQIIVSCAGVSQMEQLNEFDFGFCQAAFDGQNVIATESFTVDYRDKTMTLVSCNDLIGFDRSMVRYNRFKLKYPEFSLVLGEFPLPEWKALVAEMLNDQWRT